MKSNKYGEVTQKWIVNGETRSAPCLSPFGGGWREATGEDWLIAKRQRRGDSYVGEYACAIYFSFLETISCCFISNIEILFRHEKYHFSIN
jgi:hypothetical protein